MNFVVSSKCGASWTPMRKSSHQALHSLMSPPNVASVIGLIFMLDESELVELSRIKTGCNTTFASTRLSWTPSILALSTSYNGRRFVDAASPSHSDNSESNSRRSIRRNASWPFTASKLRSFNN